MDTCAKESIMLDKQGLGISLLAQKSHKSYSKYIEPKHSLF